MTKKWAVQARPKFREETPGNGPKVGSRRDISDVAMHNMNLCGAKIKTDYSLPYNVLYFCNLVRALTWQRQA